MFKTEPLYPPDQPEDAPPGSIWASLVSFFGTLWQPQAQPAEYLGYAYVYDEQGTLLAEYGQGGNYSTGAAQYIWLPTPSGPMPIAAVINARKFAVHADHLNTPRRLTNDEGQVAWQWKYSAFGRSNPP